MSKNAEHQEAYRKRREADDAWRLNTYLSSAARHAVVTTSVQQGLTRKDALEQLIQTGAATMQRNQYREDQSGDQPSRPSQMTVAEFQELEKFKAELPNAIISAELDARQVQANGGSAAISQKERVTASFLANNIHRK